MSSQDMRYQWAIENTEKEFLFVMHDDIQFKSNIIERYLESITKDSRMAIVGDLGQCWRCAFASQGCTPQKIISGYRPSKNWPNTSDGLKSHKWACRINEWSALIRVSAAKNITNSEGVYFGNYDCDGDIAAYWFSMVIDHGYLFNDPLPSKEERNNYYSHWENGITGHSAWVNQGSGKNPYTPEIYINLLNKEFSYKF